VSQINFQKKSPIKLNLSLEDNTNQILPKTKYMMKNYATWRKFRKNISENYYILPVEIKKYLPFLKSSALNLYLFYCLNANNEEGSSWYSTDSLAKALNTTSRSINNWNKELINLDLIHRSNDKKISSTTFLMPISDYYVEIKSQNIQSYLDTVYTDVDGDLISIAHLFQWRKNTNSDEYDQPYNVFLLTFEKNIVSEELNIKKKKYVLLEIEDEKMDNFASSFKIKEFKEDIYQFNSPLENEVKQKVLFKGIALATKFNLKHSDYRYVLETIVTISDNLKNINEENTKKI